MRLGSGLAMAVVAFDLAWELPSALGVALKSKKKKERERGREREGGKRKEGRKEKDKKENQRHELSVVTSLNHPTITSDILPDV